MPSLRILSLNVSLADPDAPPVDQDGNPIRQPPGIQPIPLELTLQPGILSTLPTEDTAPRDLDFANIALFTLSVDQLMELLRKYSGLESLTASVYLVPDEGPKEKLLMAFYGCTTLEEVEITYYPSLELFRAAGCEPHQVNSPSAKVCIIQIRDNRAETLTKVFPLRTDIGFLFGKCSYLKRFDASILRTPSLGEANWALTEGIWKGGLLANLNE